MKRLFVLMILTLALILIPVATSAAVLNVTISGSQEGLTGSSIVLPIEIINNSSTTIDKGTLTIWSVDGKPLAKDSGFELMPGSPASVDIQNLEPRNPQKVRYQISISSGLNPGVRKVGLKFDVNGESVEGFASIEVLKSSAPAAITEVNVKANAQIIPNNNFVYKVEIENPKITGSQDMINVKVELLDIDGKEIKEFTAEEAKQDSFFRLIFNSPKIFEIPKIEPDKTMSADFRLSTGPDIAKGIYHPKVKITWQPADPTIPQQTKIVDGEIEIGNANWFTFGIRWFIDAVSKTIGFGSYAFGIILFSILLKLLLLPLSNAQFRSMAKMQKIQPQINAINAKYPGKENADKKQQEIMRVYKENNFNPLSGCLPMLIQLPVFFLLLPAIYDYCPLNYNGFLWIPSLGLPDPIYIMPILLVIVTWFQQRASIAPGQEQQSQTLQYIFPLFIGWIALSFPTAMSLYWFVFTIASIAHQMWFNKGTFGSYIPVPIKFPTFGKKSQ